MNILSRLNYLLVFLLAFINDAQAAEGGGFLETVNSFFGGIVSFYAPILFYEIPVLKLPMILFIMVAGVSFLPFRFGFINIRLFKHSIDVIKGKYDNPDDEGEISHFQALTSALSATVGLGNIAGVAVAIQLGGQVLFFGYGS